MILLEGNKHMIIAALIFSALCLIVIVFQFALVLGAPWGEYTMGGELKGALPPRRRAAAGVQIVILILFALVALTRAGLILPGFYGFSRGGNLGHRSLFCPRVLHELDQQEQEGTLSLGAGERADAGASSLILALSS